jgi:putative membrane protein
MKTCTKILMSAVMSVSIGAAAFAQSSTGGAAAGSSASGNQNQTGGSAPAAGGTGLTTPSDSSTGSAGTGTSSSGASSAGASSAGASSSGAAGATGTDALGSQSSDTSHTMQGGAMGAADAQISAQLDKIASMPDKAGDALFVMDVAKDNMFEVAFAQLAQQKSQDDKIKDLAKMIEKDHTEANDQLKPIAQKMGLELPSSLPSDKQKMLSVFQSMSAQDFDTCYLLDNKASHAKDITSFTDHQKSVKDEDLRKYVTTVLPKLQQHGMHVSMLASEKGYPSPMGMGGRGGMGHGGMDHSGSDNNAK